MLAHLGILGQRGIVGATVLACSDGLAISKLLVETLLIAVVVAVFAIPMTLLVVMSIGLAVGVRLGYSSQDVGHVLDLLRCQLPYGSEVRISRRRCLGYNKK